MSIEPRNRLIRVHRGGLLLALLWLVCTLVNVTKAVHVDDTAHLAIAAHIESDPLHPMSGEVFWAERPEPIHRLNQPHLFFFMIAGLRALGGSLIVLHLALAAFAGLALWATWRSALACGIGEPHALFVAAAVGLGPAFAPSQNLMTDVPLLALWMLTLFLLISAPTDRSGGRIALAGGMIGAACLVKYTSLVLLPLFAWWLWTRHRRHLAAALIPVVALALWSAFNLWDYGGVHLVEREVSVTGLGSPAATVGVTFGRAALWVITLGAVSPFTLAFAHRVGNRFGARRIAIGAAIGVLCCAFGGQVLAAYGPEVLRGETWIHSALRGAFFLNGALTIALTVSALRRTWDSSVARLLGVWVGTVTLFIVVLSPFVAVRHVLLALPPMLALMLLDPDERPAKRARSAGLALSALIGLGVAVADWRIADVYRDLPSELSGELGRGRGRVLYLGHWGFQHYAEEAGWEPYVPGQTELEPGDRIVRPAMVDQPALSEDDEARLVVAHESVLEAGPLDLFRTITPRLGYYSVWHGLPWTLSLAPLETVHILELPRGAT